MVPYLIGGGSIVVILAIGYLLHLKDKADAEEDYKQDVDNLIQRQKEQDAINDQVDKDTATGWDRVSKWLKLRQTTKL